MRRFAAHIGDDTYVMWVLSEKMGAAAVSAIQYTVGAVPPDESTLTWLKEQIQSVQRTPWRPEQALSSFRDMEVQSWMVHPSEHKAWKEGLLEEIEDETTRQEMQKLTAAELFERARLTFDVCTHRVIEILGRDVPYSQKCAEITQVIDRAKDKAQKGDPIVCLMDSVEHLEGYYRIHINATAQFNAVMNAIEIYLAKARSGQLPKELPAHLPEDPYSGQSFEYEVTKDGFLLRCRARAEGWNEIRQFEFKVGDPK